jgi:hypothetical protein
MMRAHGKSWLNAVYMQIVVSEGLDKNGEATVYHMPSNEVIKHVLDPVTKLAYVTVHTLSENEG